MNEKDNIIYFSNRKVVSAPHRPSPLRARAYLVKTGPDNYNQYRNTVKAYTLARMPFKHIANAADSLGDKVEENEIDAPVVDGWQNKVGEIAEDRDKILAWQTREKVDVAHQLPTASPVTGQEMVTISKAPAIEPVQGKIDVVEGIKVVETINTSLSSSSSGDSPENNIYLKTYPEDLKKAA